MIKRTIEISREPAHVAVRLEQLLLSRNGDTIASIPCEDIGVVVVDHAGTTYTHGALAQLARSDAVLVVCGQDHLPSAVLLPLANHSQIVWRLTDQMRVRRPLRKQLWKQLIRAQIRAQARNLPEDCPAQSKLLDLSRFVRSGDPNNVEAHAARVYWDNWLPEEPFCRGADEHGLNPMLNYGYAIVRAAIARALVAAGLLPALGLSHRNRANAFCLADDLIEPIRPLVDARARELWRRGCGELTQETKAHFLEILAEPVSMNGEKGPLMVNLHRMVASLVDCFRGESRLLEIPQACS